MEDKVIKELNKELQGVIMGENETMKLLEKANDSKVIELLKSTLKIAEKNRILITEEIKRLGGEPTPDEGTWGKFVEFFNSIKEMDTITDKEVLQIGLKGTEMGFKGILDFLIKESDLNEDFKKKLIQISDEYSTNIKEMEEYLIELN